MSNRGAIPTNEGTVEREFKYSRVDWLCFIVCYLVGRLDWGGHIRAIYQNPPAGELESNDGHLAGILDDIWEGINAGKR